MNFEEECEDWELEEGVLPLPGVSLESHLRSPQTPSAENNMNIWSEKSCGVFIVSDTPFVPTRTAKWEDWCSAFPILIEPDPGEPSISKTCELTFEKLKGTNSGCQGSNLTNSSKSPAILDFTILKDVDLYEYFSSEDIILQKIETIVRHKIVPDFWNSFAVEVLSDFAGFRTFQDAVNNLYVELSVFASTLKTLENIRTRFGVMRALYGETSALGSLKVYLRASLHAQLPLNHSFITEQFYRIAFNAFCHSDRQLLNSMETGDDLLQCEGCSQEVDSCECADIILVFNDVNAKLIELDILERVAGEVITSLIHTKIEHYVAETCKGTFDKSYIATLEVWLETQVMQWLGRVYVAGPAATVLRNFQQKLIHFLYETYTRTRIDQLFNIIIEYPDSQPAIEDLRTCLTKTDLRSYLVQTVRSALENRLLHPGVNTTDVLTAYIAAIRSLRQLDPSGVLLEMVTQPVRHYLRQRDDTVRYVVTSLTEDGPSDLAEELSRAEELIDDGSPEDEGGVNWENWTPDPMDADPATMSRSRRTSDIISMLVTIYGSKDLFVNEYRTLLADRLLTHLTFDTEKEIRYLELLKIRFGESQLHFCEVMLKDVFDSKRINSHLHSDAMYNLKTEDVHTSALILSAQFWPPFKDEKLDLPPFIKEYLAIYTKAFETLKGNRTLSWKPHLGNVVMDIELKDRKINVSVSPIHATILWLFQEQNQWTIDELSLKTLVTATVLRRKIAYWQSQGILREISTDTFLLVEESPLRSRHHNPVDVCDEDEAESAMASAQDQREEELQVFWSYIVGMLTNLDSLPLERIHQMLKMFASQGECSLQELRHFLERKVRDHELLFSGGLYRLPKP